MAANIDLPERAYVFDRNHASSVRLNLFHWITKGLMGYLLHPKIAFPKDARIADVGAGTAIWLQELGEQIPPPATLDGYDISSDQYPARQWLMPNVKLSVHDCFQPFPEDLVSTYDVVQARYFRCVVKNNDADPLLRGLVSLLKPGGFLQFVELLSNEAKVRAPPNTETSATEQLVRTHILPTPDFPADWIQNIPQHLERYGMEIITAERIPVRAPYFLPQAQHTLMSIDETAGRGDEEQSHRRREWRNALAQEMAQGVTMDRPHYCVVARKKQDVRA